jgi:hypothetical protein
MATGTSMSSYLEDQLLNWIKGSSFAAAPVTLYAALYTVNPNDAQASGTEVSGNAYARVAITSATGWSAIVGAGAGTGDSITNSGIVTFPTPTGAGWGTVTGFALYDAATVGNEIVWAALAASKVINAGDTVTFAIGALSIAFD